MKLTKTLAIGCAALMGLTLWTPPQAEARRYRRVVRVDDDGVRVTRTVRSRPRVMYRGYRSYPRYSRYYRSHPRFTRWGSPRWGSSRWASSRWGYPRAVRYSRRPFYSSGFYSSPSYYWSSYPRYYTRPINYYYSDPYYCAPRSGVSLSFGGGRYWGW